MVCYGDGHLCIFQAANQLDVYITDAYVTLLHFCHVFRRALRHMYIVGIVNNTLK